MVVIRSEADRARDRQLTRQIAQAEREGVLAAGEAFRPEATEDDLRLIEARLLRIDALRERLITKRAVLRRVRWTGELMSTQREQIAGKGKRTDIMSAEIPSRDR